MAKLRFDIVSDTHGFLSPALLSALEGADAIVHAGDICSPSDYRTLEDIAPLHLCLGNNDWAYDYGRQIKKTVLETLERLDVIEPEADWKQPLEVAYGRWKQELNNSLK